MTGRKPESGKSLGDLYPKLLSEWDYEANGEITPFDVFPHSGKKYWWICPICGGHYSQRVVKKNVKKPAKMPILQKPQGSHWIQRPPIPMPRAGKRMEPKKREKGE